MTRVIAQSLMAGLSEWVTLHTGLSFPREKWGDLERGIGQVCQELGFKEIESCSHWLLSSPLSRAQIEMLASCLTIGETYFFREKRIFEILEREIFPELIRAHRSSDRRLRVWSAGCCTGEEAYSLAILLDRMIPDLHDWHVSILATDINPRFLRKAEAGVYGEWSFRDSPPWLRERYFRAEGKGMEILPEIRKMVTFSYHNLAMDPYPSLLNHTNAMDLIFCRNVLIYFAPERARGVIQNLHHSLVDGGWLAVSSTEISHDLFSRFDSVQFPGAILYKKSEESTEAIPSCDAAGSAPELSASPEIPEITLPLSHSPLQPDAKVKEAEVREPEAVEEEPSLFDRGLSLFEQGEYEESAKKLMELLHLEPDYSKAQILLARACANQGKLSEALKWCESAVAAEKLNPVPYYLRATILQELGRVKEAEHSLKQALYADPDFLLAHVAMGHLARKTGKLQDSERHFRNAYRLLIRFPDEAVLAETGGMTAGRLMQMLSVMKEGGVPQ